MTATSRLTLIWWPFLPWWIRFTSHYTSIFWCFTLIIFWNFFTTLNWWRSFLFLTGFSMLNLLFNFFLIQLFRFNRTFFIFLFQQFIYLHLFFDNLHFVLIWVLCPNLTRNIANWELDCLGHRVRIQETVCQFFSIVSMEMNWPGSLLEFLFKRLRNKISCCVNLIRFSQTLFHCSFGKFSERSLICFRRIINL